MAASFRTAPPPSACRRKRRAIVFSGANIHGGVTVNNGGLVVTGSLASTGTVTLAGFVTPTVLAANGSVGKVVLLLARTPPSVLALRPPVIPWDFDFQRPDGQQWQFAIDLAGSGWRFDHRQRHRQFRQRRQLDDRCRFHQRCHR